ncbi:HNH endonuclease [Pasteurellaceae bacterium HPA106]|uniref:HNH endonuclease signature motif containing protein n=1 Tax=Spirabiliibacterium pneumoniae TaxID=221400 RepID=UPI001AAC9203|nr:HNH endonuclease signature motif containing protein [Spirabiliibacterium pneumoniae]MBE2895721.1 HNH endonuclease [Spirabiliibacterium pneumoniae]
MASTTRNYKREYKTYHGKPQQIKNRSLRNKARRIMKNELGKSAIKGKEIDHKKPLSKGGTNKRNNLRVVSRSTNRKKGGK